MSEITNSLIASQKLAQKIESLLLESGGELNDELESLLVFQTESKEALKSQVDEVAQTLERIDSLTEYYSKQLQVLNRVLTGLESTKDKLSSNVMSAMHSMQVEDLRGNNIEFKLRQNPPSVEILDEAIIPDQFSEIVVSSKIKKKDIKEAINSGVEVPGARLTQKQSLKIQMARPQLTKGV